MRETTTKFIRKRARGSDDVLATKVMDGWRRIPCDTTTR